MIYMIKSLPISKIVFFVSLALICIFFCEFANAAEALSSAGDNTDMSAIDKAIYGVQDSFKNGIGEIGIKITELAKAIFFALACITLIWNVSLLALKNGDISNISFEVIKFMIVMSIFWWFLSGVDTLLEPLANDLGKYAKNVAGFKSSGGASIINTGLDICKEIIAPSGNTSWGAKFVGFWNSVSSPLSTCLEWLLKLLLCIFVLVICAVITMNLALCYLDFIFTLYGGIIILGLASSDLFKSDSIAYLKGMLGKAVLFYGQIICAVFCFAGIKNLLAKYAASEGFFEALITLLSLGIGVFMASKVISSVPKAIAGFISPHASAYTPMVDAGQAGMAAVKLGTMATGAGSIATAAGVGGLSSMGTKGAFNKFAGTGVGQSVIGNAKIASGLVANSAAGKIALGTGRIAGGAVSAFAKQMSSMLNDIKKQ